MLLNDMAFERRISGYCKSSRIIFQNYWLKFAVCFREMSGAAKHLHEMPWLADLPERGDKREVNVLAGLELHEHVITEDEEVQLVGEIEM